MSIFAILFTEMVVITEDMHNETEDEEKQLVTDGGKPFATGQQQTSGNYINKKAPMSLTTLHDASRHITFLPARRYASAGYSDRNVSVCPSVRHAPVLCQNEES